MSQLRKATDERLFEDVWSSCTEGLPHRRYSGRTGSGKTTAACRDLLDIAVAGDRWECLFFPHPQFAIKCASELYSVLGDEFFDRVIIECLKDSDRVVMRQYVQVSSHPDPYQRELENDEFRNAFVDVLMRQQGITNLSENPAKFKYTHLAIAIKQHQSVWWPDSLIPYAIRNHKFFDFAKAHCTDENLKFEMDEIRRLGNRERALMVESAARLLDDVLGSPVNQARTCKQETTDWAGFWNKGGIYIGIGGGISDHAFAVHRGSIFQRLYRDALNGKLVRDGIIWDDEALNYRSYAWLESKAISTVRAFGISMWHAVQSQTYPDDDITSNVGQNVDEYVFRQGDPTAAEQFARSLKRKIDRNKIHHEETIRRQVAIPGSFDIFVTKGTSVSKGEKGKSVSQSENQHLVQKYEEIEERRPVYESPSDQLQWLSQELLGLPVGTCYVREGESVPYLKRYERFPDSWYFPGLAEAKFREAMEIMKCLPPFEKPIPTSFPTMPSPTSGMKKSSNMSKGSHRPRGK